MVKKVYAAGAILILSFALFSFACTQKTVPVITSRKTEPVKKELPALSMQPDLVLGKVIFENRCSKCHDLPKPDQFTKERWGGILSYMMPRARLNNEQSVHVSAYLKENAAK